ncbi:MAG: DUF935 domain-containing protein [Azoarcus sp.]|jgi:phage gp29-like protein|nr:DUF935 domain-containing protein [Azoarcus sp.]
MLVDQYGNPIERASLKKEQARPTPNGVRRIGQSASTSALDPLKAARILRQAEEGDASAYLGIAEEMEEKYLHYGAQLATRKRAVSGIEPIVVAASDENRDREIADFVREQIPVIREATRHLLDAIGKGYSVCEILWDTSGKYWAPRELIWRDPRWFAFDKEDGKTLRLRNEVGSEPLSPGHYVIHTCAAKSGLPIRGGLARGAIWAFLFHNFSIRDWVTFIEQFGKPLRLGRYDDTDKPADIAVLYDAVRDLGKDAAAILPRSMEIEFPEVANARGDNAIWRALLEYLDRQVSKLVLGQTLTADTGETGGGSYALGAVHNDVRLDILKDDAQSLAATINRDLVRLLVDLNFAGVEKRPEYTLPVAEPEDLTAKAAIVEKAVAIGCRVPAKWFSEAFGIPLPKDGEEVLGGTADGNDETDAGMQRRRVAMHAAGTEADAMAVAVSRLEADTAPEMATWIGQIEAMLEAAGSLEEFRAMLIAAYPKLSTEALAEKLATAGMALQLRGRFGVEEGK